MRRGFDNQVMPVLAPVKRRLLPGTAPEGLLQALADLLLEALGKQNNGIPAEREAVNAGEKMHRRAGVKMHHGAGGWMRPISGGVPRSQLSGLIDEPAFPSQPGIAWATSRNVGDGR